MRRAWSLWTAVSCALLALGACRRQSSSSLEPAEETKAPLQLMSNLDATIFSTEGQTWNIKSRKADVLDAQETLFLSNPVMRSFKGGRLDSTLTAERGWFDTVRQNLRAQDNVVVVSTDGAKLETSWLLCDERSQLISSTAPVRIIRSDSITQGHNLIATMDLSSATLTDETVEIPKQDKPSPS